MWGFRVELAKSLELTADGFDLEANIFTQIARRRFTIGQVPINYRRRHGRSKLTSLKDGWRIGRRLIADRFNLNRK
jgi:dolichol-phosphate mannosyltransferase